MHLDAIFDNGRFQTLDPARPTASRIGILAGRIAGLDEEIDGATASTRHDLGGAHVVPGFNDAHQHLSMRGRRLRSLDLRSEVAASLDDLYAAVEEFALNLPEGAWIKGSGYDQNKIGAHPTAEMLDKVSAGHPVWLEHVSAHMGVANTEAFRRAGYTERVGVPDVPGGYVERDASGVAVGLLQETALHLVTDAFQPTGTDEIVDYIRAGSEAGVAEGLTSATEPGIGAVDHIGNSPIDLYAFQRARAEDALKVRMTLMPYITVLRDLGALEGESRWAGLDLGIRTGFGDEYLRLGPTKIATDGSLIGRSAYMSCCYHDDSTNRGFMQFTPQEVNDLIAAAHRSGWSVAAHAIGDAAVDSALDAFELAQQRHPRQDHRHRIEHFAVASDAQVRRLVRLGVTAVPQGRFISELGDGMMRALGPERSLQCYRMRSLLEAGAVLPGSSDSPVAHGAPLLNIHDMVNRLTSAGTALAPDERLTPLQALEAYTTGSAYAAGEERIKGRLQRGMLADFAVLTDDLLAVEPGRIKDISVGATVIGGEIVYNNGAL